MTTLVAGAAIGGGLAATATEPTQERNPPAVGDRAPDFTLRDLAGKEVRLKDLSAQTPVVLLVLRGYPGYQCPICSRQVAEFLGHAGDFKAKGSRVVMVYPGPADDLDEHAKEFVGGKSFPEGFTFLTDPDFVFTQAYRLRWDAPRETAYPSAFVIDSQGTVKFAKVSRTHAGRASAAEVLGALDAIRGGHGR